VDLNITKKVLLVTALRLRQFERLEKWRLAEYPMPPADKPLVALMDDFRALVTRARAGRLRASELAAPTNILTSLGEASVDAVFPIIQPPQVAIVGAGAVAARPWVVDGQVVPRQVLTLSLGADHRVTDGRLGAQFLARIAAKLLEPESL
jgi:pyruvate dehydrogenase E2 component (dihydrolipoamide acetyltransferase)